MHYQIKSHCIKITEKKAISTRQNTALGDSNLVQATLACLVHAGNRFFFHFEEGLKLKLIKKFFNYLGRDHWLFNTINHV